MSLFDLNIENKKIERPFKPVIRFGIPLCNKRKTKAGVLILNYLGNHLLNLIKRTNPNIMLVNAEGYWLHNPNPQNTWGFMIPERQNRRFSADFSLEWSRINSSQTGQFHNHNGLFTFDTIFPLKKTKKEVKTSSINMRQIEQQHTPIKDDYWKLISYIPEIDLITHTRPMLIKYILISTVACFIASFFAWYIAKTIVRRKLYQRELFELANFDKLTGLPNRTLFFNRLYEIHNNSQSFNLKYGILFIDLNGFKEINDTLGHDAGDQVLKMVSSRLKKCLRQSDIVARLGGDEFVIIIPEIHSHENIKPIIEKLEKTLALPMDLNTSQRTISASIGACTYPLDGNSPETILQKADDAMYKRKAIMKKANPVR